MGICLRYASSKPEAEDILQESFVRIFKSLSIDIQSLDAWVTRVTVNTAIRQFQRGKKWSDQLDIDRYENTPSSDAAGLQHLQLTDLLELIQTMPDGYRIVFNLSVIDGFSHDEIATHLGIAASASRSQLYRAKNWLQESIKKREQQYGKS